MRKRIIIILTLLNCAICFGQTILIPGIGIQDDSIKINETEISIALQKYGDSFEIIENEHFITYSYKSLGISFSIYPYDRNRLIREISFESPYKAQTNTGVVLNKTTWKELKVQHGFNGGFTNGGSYVYIPFNGGAYLLTKNKKKRGWNDSDSIIKIMISNKQADGTPKQINYVYNIELEIQSIEGVYQFINNNPSLTRLTDYFKNPEQTFAPRIKYIDNRTINERIDQSEIRVEVGATTYGFNILSKNDTIFYLQTRKPSKDSVIFNYRNETLLANCIKQHNTFYQTDIETLDENSFISKKFVYGSGCGLAGIQPAKRHELDLLIRNKDYQTISKWLRSMNPEIQAYGLEGMYMLSKSGVKLTFKDIELMEHLVNKPFKIYSCIGCIYGINKRYADIIAPKVVRKMKKNWRYHKSGNIVPDF